MEKSIIATGKTLELAIDAALKQLNMDRDSVSVEIIEKAKSGFLGIGAVPAKIKVTYEVPDEAPAPALSSASRSKPKKVAAAEEPAKPQQPQEIKKEVLKQAPKQSQRPAKNAEKPNPPQKKSAPKPQAKPAAPKAPVEYKPAEPGSMEEKIETFIAGLLQHMGSNAVPHCAKNADEVYQVELVGDSLGALIGRRGETLDAIQHLTNYSVNHENDKRIRISVDAENYRRKREESLERLATKVAGKVLKYHRNITLEPMNAYERHVIHAALQETPNITTFSTGTEPNRRIVVAYNKEGIEK